MNILQVVGYKNSGKTTVSSEIISYAASKGIRVGSLKHHSHGSPDVVAGTDSDRHQQAGSTLAGVEGDGFFNLSVNLQDYKYEDIMSIYHLLRIELLIIEGYKEKNYPKIVCIRKEEDLSLLDTLENIQAVFLHSHLSLPNRFNFPAFTGEEKQSFKRWIDSCIK